MILSDARWAPVEGSVLGEGRVAWVAWVPGARGDGAGGKLMHADDAPTEAYLRALYDLRVQKTLVCPLEEVGIAAPYFSERLAPLIAGKQVIHLADNKAANAGARRASSSAADLARVISVMHAKWAQLGLSPWVGFVGSEANLADLPSRRLYELLRSMGSERVDFVFPPVQWA